MTSRFMKAALVLGLLSAIGPFAIDMYLPALPAIGKSLNASENLVQVSLMAFFISVGVGQLIYGPMSDMFGRKSPIYLGLCIFALSSIGCALAPNIHSLIAFRFLQGLGACAVMVIPRAIVRDMHTGNDAARLMSLLMLVFSVSPVLAPLTGSLVIQFASWRGIFWLVTAAALLGFVLITTSLAETRPPSARLNSTVASALASYATLFRDRYFLGVVLAGSFGVASFFAYIANSSFVLIDHYGLTPTHYSLAFSVNAISFIGASQFTARLGARYGLKNVVRTAVIGFAATMMVLTALTVGGIDRLDVLMAMLVIGYGFLGLVIPGSAVLALDRHGAIAGTASALMGTLQFGTGAVVVAAISFFVDGTSKPMVEGIAACAVLSMIFARVTLRERRPTTHPSQHPTSASSREQTF